MPSEYPRTPKLIKGALVKLSEEFLVPIPNVIVFQYNPTTITRKLTPSAPSAVGEGQGETSTTAEPFDPGESFDLKLILDATDALEEPQTHPVASLTGVADRLAAIEMLLYPVGDMVVSKALSKLGGKKKKDVPQSRVPIVLLVWGPGRIVPVRLTTFSVDEQMFSPSLYPIRATVTIGLQVLNDQAFNKPEKDLSASEKLALFSYKWTRGQKEVLARTNLANTAESILGMLPF